MNEQQQERYRRLRIRLDGAAERMLLARVQAGMAVSTHAMAERQAALAADRLAVVRATLDAADARREHAPPGFAAALAAGEAWSLPDGKAVTFGRRPDADPDEIWAGVMAWQRGHAA